MIEIRAQNCFSHHKCNFLIAPFCPSKCVILKDKVTVNGITSATSFLQRFSCGDLLLFALRLYLPGRAEAEKSNKGKRQRTTVKVITNL